MKMAPAHRTNSPSLQKLCWIGSHSFTTLQVAANSPESCQEYFMMECTARRLSPNPLLIYLSVSLRTSYPVSQWTVIMLQPLAKGDMSYS